MVTSRPVGSKLFIEGIEVPFVGATITSTENSSSIAYIDLVPHYSINDIKPRTHVVLAVRDHNDPDNDYPYVLAWEGEVFGIAPGKSTTGRGFSIQCIDLTGYWDNVLIYFINILHSLGKGLGEVAQTGSTANSNVVAGIKTQATTHSNTSYLRQTMQKALSKNGTDLLDGFIALYDDISKINSFYNLAEDRLRIKERIVMHSSKNLDQLLKGNETLDWLEGIATRTTGYQTLRMVIQDLMSLIFHDYVTVPCPSRVDSKRLTKKPLKKIKNEVKTIGNFIFKPNLFMIPPPSCNIFFPDEYSSFQFSRNFFQEPTRMHYRPEMPRSLLGDKVVLPIIYQPASYDAFVFQKEGDRYPGVDETTSDGEQGTYGSENIDGINTSQKREYDFLTEEEKYKCIFLAIENMMPATTQYTASVNKTGNTDFARKISEYLFHKKRYENRNLQITSHLKLSVVPGCPVLILDDSEADQNIVAYCSSVTHRIYATEGGHTTVSLSYARNVAEKDIASNRGHEPPIPPWFAASVFGKSTDKPSSKAAKKEVGNMGVQNESPDALSDFYKALLGDKGSKAITNLKVGERTVLGSVRAILAEYAAIKRKKDPEAIQKYISKITSRDYVRLRDSFDFLGCTTQTKDLRFDSFIEFRGDSYAGVGRKDAPMIKNKRTIIENYRKHLKDSRGFKG